ncbi:MAG: hypothetical protein IJT41_07240 [Clostridia bacterium]|nr:hypothetical protein [Clostridia bacterium]
MRSFKTALCKVALFTLIFALICSPVVCVYLKNGSENNNINAQLEEEKGKIDFLFCGASQSVWGFIPLVMDAELACNSFNISSGLLSMEGRYTIIRKVAQDNPVKNLVLDLSYNSILREDKTDSVEGELLLEERLHGMERIRYYCTHTKVDEIFPSFYYVMRTGMYSILHSFSAKPDRGMYFGKGYWGEKAAIDQRRDVRWKTGDRQSAPEPVDIPEENLVYLEKIMQFCKENGIRVYLITTAYPTGVISWSDRDGLLQAHVKLARQYGCPFYDVNLLRDKDKWFDDETSYYDVEHTSTQGAVAQTKLLASWIRSASPGVGEDAQFYDSYADMIDAYLARSPEKS